LSGGERNQQQEKGGDMIEPERDVGLESRATELSDIRRSSTFAAIYIVNCHE
jgi:hypothetical protein